MVKHHDELASARAELASIRAKLERASTALDEINASPLLLTQIRVATGLARAKADLQVSLGFVAAFRKLRKRMEQDSNIAPGVDAGNLRAFLKDPATAACGDSLPPEQYAALIAAGRSAIAAGRVPIKRSKRPQVLSLLDRAIKGDIPADKVSLVRRFRAEAASLARNPELPKLEAQRANLARQVESFRVSEQKARERVSAAETNVARAMATARWYRRVLARGRRDELIKAVLILGIVAGAIISGGMLVIFLINLPPPDTPTTLVNYYDDGGGSGGGGSCCLGQCKNETDCIYYRWGDYAVGIMAVDTPYNTPHELVDPVPFQTSLRVGGDLHSGGDLVTDYVRAPANTSLWLKSPFEYGGEVRNEYSVLGFKVPWSDTGNIYIQELLYDPGLDQTWAIVWLDGSSWCLLKFPWI